MVVLNLSSAHERASQYHFFSFAWIIVITLFQSILVTFQLWDWPSLERNFVILPFQVFCERWALFRFHYFIHLYYWSIKALSISLLWNIQYSRGCFSIVLTNVKHFNVFFWNDNCSSCFFSLIIKCRSEQIFYCE